MAGSNSLSPRSASHLLHTDITPPWPGVPYALACPQGTPQASCDLLSRNASSSWLTANGRGCFEPERDTAEVLNSLLLGCHARPCIYVDIGCNLGAFAAQAAALGARDVLCYELAPHYVEAIETTRELNHFGQDGQGFVVRRAAVVPGVAQGSREFGGAYNPCLIVPPREHRWRSPEISIHSILRQATRTPRRSSISGASPHMVRTPPSPSPLIPVTLLKIDIDSNEGALLGVVVRMLERREVGVESILIELGDNKGATAWGRGRPPGDPQHDGRNSSRYPRGGNVADLYKLQHGLGYDLYRLNIAVGREIFDWRGHDVNTRKVAQAEGVEALFGVRSMRKLERVLPSLPLDSYPSLLSWGVSFLATRVRLAEPATHHTWDLRPDHSGLGSLESLNRGNPAVVATRRRGGFW